MIDYKEIVSHAMAEQLYIWTLSGCDSMNKACESQSQTKSEHIDRSYTYNSTPSMKLLVIISWQNQEKFSLIVQLIVRQS